MHRATAALWLDDHANDGGPSPVVTPRPTGATAAGGNERRALDGVVSAALLTATAFRLRDEAGLIRALRALVAAVDTLEHDGD